MIFHSITILALYLAASSHQQVFYGSTNDRRINDEITTRNNHVPTTTPSLLETNTSPTEPLKISTLKPDISTVKNNSTLNKLEEEGIKSVGGKITPEVTVPPDDGLQSQQEVLYGSTSDKPKNDEITTPNNHVSTTTTPSLLEISTSTTEPLTISTLEPDISTIKNNSALKNSTDEFDKLGGNHEDTDIIFAAAENAPEVTVPPDGGLQSQVNSDNQKLADDKNTVAQDTSKVDADRQQLHSDEHQRKQDKHQEHDDKDQLHHDEHKLHDEQHHHHHHHHDHHHHHHHHDHHNGGDDSGSSPTIPAPDTTGSSNPDANPTTATVPSVNPTTSPDSSANPTTSPDSSANPTTSPGSSANPTTSPDSSANPTTSPDSSANPTTSPDSSANPTTSPDSSANPTTSPDSSANPTTSPDSSANPTTSPDSSANPTTSPDSSANSTTPQQSDDDGGEDEETTAKPCGPSQADLPSLVNLMKSIPLPPCIPFLPELASYGEQDIPFLSQLSSIDNEFSSPERDSSAQDECAITENEEQHCFTSSSLPADFPLLNYFRR